METSFSMPVQSVTGDRSVFMAKVFSLFGLALLFSVGGIVIGIQVAYAYPQIFLNNISFYSIFAIELILIFTSRLWSQVRGLNYALFILFAMMSGFTVVPILIMAEAIGGYMLIVKALAATVAMFLGVAMYGYVTHRDLTGMRGFLLISLIGIIISSVVNIFVQSGMFDYILSWITVVVFSGFVMYHIQMIKNKYPENMYIEAALALYLDFFNLFINILNIMMGSGRR